MTELTDHTCVECGRPFEAPEHATRCIYCRKAFKNGWAAALEERERRRLERAQRRKAARAAKNGAIRPGATDIDDPMGLIALEEGDER